MQQASMAPKLMSSSTSMSSRRAPPPGSAPRAFSSVQQQVPIVQTPAPASSGETNISKNVGEGAVSRPSVRVFSSADPRPSESSSSVLRSSFSQAASFDTKVANTTAVFGAPGMDASGDPSDPPGWLPEPELDRKHELVEITSPPLAAVEDTVAPLRHVHRSEKAEKAIDRGDLPSEYYPDKLKSSKTPRLPLFVPDTKAITSDEQGHPEVVGGTKPGASSDNKKTGTPLKPRRVVVMEVDSQASGQ
ncbi:hypothetical protein C8F01DRAFT_1098244 [Mycena amicta]|nr:hypothetical protein C8F01DRAFT_1098244 [Mycena amicta]